MAGDECLLQGVTSRSIPRLTETAAVRTGARMRVVAHPIEHPAALAYVDNDAVLFIKVGLLAPAIIAFLDRLLSTIRIAN